MDVVLSTDPKLRQGRLENGFEYYIRANAKPKERAHFQLVVKAGSLLEDEDQRGLAHILEHMAFNGSTNFKSGDLVEYFTSIGMRFGAHLNAMTSFEKTIYKLQVPTTDQAILNKTFAIMRDWCSELSFLPEEIERERNVGLEEWRQGLGGMRRAFQQLMPTTFFGGIHTERLPIGTEQSLRSFSHEALTRFYRKWYRPENTGLVVVGDVDPLHIERMIKTRFSDWVPEEPPIKLPAFPLTLHEETLFAVAYDSELPYPSISFLRKKMVSPARTEEQYRTAYVIPELIEHAINERLEFLTRENSAELQFVNAGSQRLTSGWTAESIRATLSEEQLEGGVKRLVQEIRRLQTFGITEQELFRAKKRYLSSIEMAYSEQNTTPSRYFIGEMVRAFTDGEIICGIEKERALARKFTDLIDVAEVNQIIHKWMTGAGRVVQLVCTKEARPDEERLQSWIVEAQSYPIEPPPKEEEQGVLLAELPASGTIIAEQENERFGVRQWTLDNGAQVWLKPTNFQSDRIVFGAIGFGGLSLAEDEDLVSARSANEVAFYSGCNGLSSDSIDRIMTGVRGRLDFQTHRYVQQVRGFGFRDDLAKLLQYFWVRTQKSQFDESSLQRIREWRENQLLNQLANPVVVYQHRFRELLWQHHPRHLPLRTEHLSLLKADLAGSFFKKAFCPAADMTYVFVGPFSVEDLKPLVLQYIGGLPSVPPRRPIDHGDRLYSGRHYEELQAGVDPKGHYRFHTVHRGRFSAEQRFAINYLTKILQERLRKELRENRGAVYSVQVSGKYSHFPEELISLEINFSCDPVQTEGLRTITGELFQDLLHNGPTEKEVQKVSKQIMISHEEHQRDDVYWLSRFLECLRRERSLNDLIDTLEMVQKMNSVLLRSLFPSLMDLSNGLELVLRPQENSDSIALNAGEERL